MAALGGKMEGRCAAEGFLVGVGAVFEEETYLGVEKYQHEEKCRFRRKKLVVPLTSLLLLLLLIALL